MSGANQSLNWNAENHVIQNIAYEAEQNAIKKLEERGPLFQVGNDKLYDECGFAVIKFNDKRSGFYKSYKLYMKQNFDIEVEDNLEFPCSPRQEKSVHTAMANAVAEYLNNKFGKVVYVKSWTD